MFSFVCLNSSIISVFIITINYLQSCHTYTNLLSALALYLALPVVAILLLGEINLVGLNV